jgi:hypothetical protein
MSSTPTPEPIPEIIVFIVNWILPIVALVISFISLYFAHLRGPDIYLVMHGKKYPTIKVKDHYYTREKSNESDGFFEILSRFLVVNTGLRPGILLDFRFVSLEQFIDRIEFDPRPESILPIPISPGEGIQIETSIFIKMETEFLSDTPSKKNTLKLRANYLVSASLGRKIRKNKTIFIDLTRLYDFKKEKSL